MQTSTQKKGGMTKMYPQLSTPSTNWPGTFSGGQQLPVYKKPLSRWLSNEDIEVQAIVHGTVNSPWQELSFTFEGEGASALKRTIGCTIVWAIPDEGIDEALTKLADIYSFTIESASLRLAPPPPETRKGHGRIMASSERPELVITE